MFLNCKTSNKLNVARSRDDDDAEEKEEVCTQREDAYVRPIMKHPKSEIRGRGEEKTNKCSQ